MEEITNYIRTLRLKGTPPDKAKVLTKAKFKGFDKRLFPRIWKEVGQSMDAVVMDLDRIKNPPYDLTEEGMEIWIKFWQSKPKEIEILSIDHFQLAAYCMEMGLYYRCRKFIIENSVKYETDKGNYVQYPEVSTANNALSNAKAIAKELGLSPLSRKRLNLASGLDKGLADPFADVG